MFLCGKFCDVVCVKFGIEIFLGHSCWSPNLFKYHQLETSLIQNLTRLFGTYHLHFKLVQYFLDLFPWGVVLGRPLHSFDASVAGKVNLALWQ